jgi:hypothetical protein
LKIRYRQMMLKFMSIRIIDWRLTVKITSKKKK